MGKRNPSLADFISSEVLRGESGGDEFTTLVKFSPNIITSLITTITTYVEEKKQGRVHGFK